MLLSVSGRSREIRAPSKAAESFLTEIREQGSANHLVPEAQRAGAHCS
jgi:hypothetical protein